MRDWKFRINEYAVVNEKAAHYLPCHVGRLIQIFELKTKGINDYTVKLENGDFVFVKEEELNKVDVEVTEIYKDVLEGNCKVTYIPKNETVTILLFDLLHNQAEITFEDSSMGVVPANKLKRIDSEGDIMVEKETKFKVGDKVITRTGREDIWNDKIGKIIQVDEKNVHEFGYKVEFSKDEENVFCENELTLHEEFKTDHVTPTCVEYPTGKFEKIATELGQFTDKKNKQYGSSVDATYEMIKVLMDRYKNEDDTYTIPQELLEHLLLMVRVMDKQNRIFNNPSGKGDSESPWRDIAGYSLMGVHMVEGK